MNTSVQSVIVNVRGKNVVRYRDRLTGRFCAKPLSMPSVSPVPSAPIARTLYSENKVFISLFLILSVLSALTGVPEMMFIVQMLTVVAIFAVSLFGMAFTISCNERIIADNRAKRKAYHDALKVE